MDDILSSLKRMFSRKNTEKEKPKKPIQIIRHDPNTGNELNLNYPSRLLDDKYNEVSFQDENTGEVYDVYRAWMRHYKSYGARIPGHSKVIIYQVLHGSDGLNHDLLFQVALEAIEVLKQNPTDDEAIDIGVFEMNSKGEWVPTKKKFKIVDADKIAPINQAKHTKENGQTREE